MDQVICHCVSQDCSNCPMKNIGTAGILAEFEFFHNYDKEKKDKEDYLIKKQ